jgi:hypothetical protein
MSIHKAVIGCVAVAVLLIVASSSGLSKDKTRGYPLGYTSTGPNGYVYVAPPSVVVPPVYPYGGYFGRGYALPPVGFGSPYYSGFNDPSYGLYGPGVREFLYFGGADFYGW